MAGSGIQGHLLLLSQADHQGAGSEGKQPEVKSASIWDTNVTGQHLIHYTKPVSIPEAFSRKEDSAVDVLAQWLRCMGHSHL